MGVRARKPTPLTRGHVLPIGDAAVKGTTVGLARIAFGHALQPGIVAGPRQLVTATDFSEDRGTVLRKMIGVIHEGEHGLITHEPNPGTQIINGSLRFRAPVRNDGFQGDIHELAYFIQHGPRRAILIDPTIPGL